MLKAFAESPQTHESLSLYIGQNNSYLTHEHKKGVKTYSGNAIFLEKQFREIVNGTPTFYILRYINYGFQYL